MLTPFATSAAISALLVLVMGLGFWDEFQQLRRRGRR